MSDETTMGGGTAIGDGTGSEQNTPQGTAAATMAQGAVDTGVTGGSLLSGNAQPVQSEGDGKGNAQVTQAPEKYDLQIPEGIYTPEQIAVAEKQFKDLGLDNAAAQKLIDTSVASQKQVREQHEAQVQRWEEEVRMDKEMGGPAFESTVAEAKSALTKFDSDGSVFGMLEQTGYANHPAVIRFLSRIGKKLGEDGVVLGNGSEQEKPLHERLYPSNT